MAPIAFSIRLIPVIRNPHPLIRCPLRLVRLQAEL
jgi:hypothetical protein